MRYATETNFMQEVSEARATTEDLQAARSLAEEVQASQAVALSDREQKARTTERALQSHVRQIDDLQKQLCATISERDRALECVAGMQDQVLSTYPTSSVG
jgi:uncharacterized coiled-coil DUF342 family protein